MFTCDSVRTRARFHPLPAPSDAEVALVTQQIAARVLRLLRREGHLPDPDDPADVGADDEPVFRTCQHRLRKQAGNVPHAPRIRRPRRYSWAHLQRRALGIDVFVCPHCQGRRKLLTFLTDPITVARVLDHLGLPTRIPAESSPRAPPGMWDLDC